MQVHRDEELHTHTTSAAMLTGIANTVEPQQASHVYGFEAPVGASWTVSAPYDATATADDRVNDASRDTTTDAPTTETSSFAYNGHHDTNDNADDDDPDDDEAMDGDDDDSGFACTQVIDEGSDAEEEEEEEDATGESAPMDEQAPEDDGNDDDDAEPNSRAAAAAAPVALQAALSPRKVASPSPKKATPPAPAPVTQQRSSPATPATPTAAVAVAEDTSALGKFASVLTSVWPMLEAQGWQEARGGDTLFCSMPGTQFFNFRPNVNVFDSREKACWKFIALAAAAPDGPSSSADAAPDTALWDLLWDVAATHFGWFTMQCGPETWFVKPETRFEAFEPNVTIFQTKKRAVVKCLEVEDVVVDLGDSVDGRQVLTFGPKKPVAAAPKKAPSTTATTTSSSSSTTTTTTSAKKKLKDVFTTPSPTIKRKDKRAAASASATKASPSPAAAASSSASKPKAKAPKKALTVTAMKQKLAAHRAKKASATRLRNKEKAPAAPAGPVFYVPEFKCTFGMVYQKLQEIGWYHRPGKFEYDYFAPTYTPETAVLNRNYFQSVAEFEEFLKDSGVWEQIEREFRDVHDDEVALLRADAIAKHEARKKKVEAREKKLAVAKAQQRDAAAGSAKAAQQAAKAQAREEATRIKQEQRLQTALSVAARVATASTPSSSSGSGGTMRRPSGFATDLQNEFKVSMGKVVKKLLARGWSYRPGRFEYDYFKPGVTLKTAQLNEDYFQSEADLETYLKISGLWDEIARELLDDHNAEQEREAMRMSQHEANAKQMKREAPSPVAHDAVKKLRVESPVAAAPPAPAAMETAESCSVAPTASSSSSTSNSRAVAMSNLMSPSKSPPPSRVAHIAADEVEELANDIWANSHHFEFERR